MFEMGQIQPKTVSNIKMRSTNLNYNFRCFEAFLTKTTNSVKKSDFLKEAKNYPERNLFLKPVCNITKSVEICFDEQIETHWSVHSFSCVIVCFSPKSTKNPVLCKKLAILEYSDLSEISLFFCQTLKTGQIVPKTLLNLKMSHIQ